MHEGFVVLIAFASTLLICCVLKVFKGKWLDRGGVLGLIFLWPIVLVAFNSYTKVMNIIAFACAFPGIYMLTRSIQRNRSRH